LRNLAHSIRSANSESKGKLIRRVVLLALERTTVQGIRFRLGLVFFFGKWSYNRLPFIYWTRGSAIHFYDKPTKHQLSAFGETRARTIALDIHDDASGSRTGMTISYSHSP